MVEWIQVTAVGVAIASLALLLILFLWRWCFYKGRKDTIDVDHTESRAESLQTGIAKLHQPSLHHHQIDLLDIKRRGNGSNYYVFRRGVSTKPLFSWADHPSLVTDAVENGWSRFGFAGYNNMSSPPTRSTLLGLCASGDYGRESDTEISWEVCQGSADFMQKIRLNPGLKKLNLISNTNSMGAASVIRTALPLPGPPLGNSAFPQEAYFEITILYCRGDQHESSSVGKANYEGEKAKLIRDHNRNSKANSDFLVHVTSSSHKINSKIEELNFATSKDHDDKGEAVMLSLGLTAGGGGSLPLKLPGSYPGSIGFNSDGSLYLDGIKLVFESEKTEWGKTGKVIGCGFDPRQKKVFFTVDAELVHVIHCQSEEFGTPLYPTLAANNDILVLVNFGQSAFIYAAANAQRTANPCFIGPLVNSPSLGYDSKELFSMGRIDSQWLNPSTTRGNNNNNNGNNGVLPREFDDESEADLFEIVLDSCGRSLSTGL